MSRAPGRGSLRWSHCEASAQMKFSILGAGMQQETSTRRISAQHAVADAKAALDAQLITIEEFSMVKDAFVKAQVCRPTADCDARLLVAEEPDWLLQQSKAALDAGNNLLHQSQPLHALTNAKTALNANLITKHEYDTVKAAFIAGQVRMLQVPSLLCSALKRSHRASCCSSSRLAWAPAWSTTRLVLNDLRGAGGVVRGSGWRWVRTPLAGWCATARWQTPSKRTWRT